MRTRAGGWWWKRAGSAKAHNTGGSGGVLLQERPAKAVNFKRSDAWDEAHSTAHFRAWASVFCAPVSTNPYTFGSMN